MTPRPARSPIPHRARRRLAGLAAVILVLGVALLGCAPPPPPPPGALDPLPVGITHAVSTRQVTFVDTSRPTPALDAYPGSPERVLPTSIWYPTDTGNGPYPLVVFAHGYGVTPAFYDALLTRIAAAGYVVAAPTYPILSGQPAGPDDVVDFDQTFGDTSFVTTKMLELSASSDADLGGTIDPQRIAVAGHSDGGYISYGDGFVPYKLDPRVRAVISYATDLDYGGLYQPNGRPFLHVLSDTDVYNDYAQSIEWDRHNLQDPRNIVSLVQATHAEPFTDPSDPHFAMVTELTIAFLDTNLKMHPEAMFWAYLDVAAHPELAFME